MEPKRTPLEEINRDRNIRLIFQFLHHPLDTVKLSMLNVEPKFMILMTN